MSFTVRLNGSNYVSKKTAAAFEEALRDDHQVQLKNNGGNGETVPKPIAASEISPEPTAAPPVQQPDYQRVLESLEHGLAQSYDHQKQTLQVHEQYLHNQGDYSKIFSQLMQQQNALFANGNGSPERLEAALKVLEQLSRSIDQFHEHQAQTLDVHNTFLSQQADYTRAFVQLLQRQCDAMLSGNGNGNGSGHVTTTPQRVSTVQSAPVPINPEPTPEKSVSSAPSEPETPSVAISTVSIDVLKTSLLEIVSDKTGYPAEMLELDMDMEADLGIDSIKRVEILSALQDKHPELPEVETEALAELRTLDQIIKHTNERLESGATSQPTKGDESQTALSTDASTPTPEPSPAAGSTLDTEALTTSLLEIVSDKTGYPAEMLELDMDMEADLGIDSIKRVEILSALQDKHPELPDVEAEALAELRTLGQITAHMEQEGNAGKKA